jgi:hypothetical protein
MFEVMLKMAALIACGIGWRLIKPFQLEADNVRQVLTSLVYGLLLPALAILVLWQAPLGLDTLRLTLSAALGVLGALLLSYIAFRIGKTTPANAGAMILAASFPNATYLGLPVLEHFLGPEGRSIAIQYDLFACTPLLLTLGIIIAQRHSGTDTQSHPLRSLLTVPPLWGAVLGITLNISNTPMPVWIAEWLQMLGGAVVPLMLFALGLSLRWSSWQSSYLVILPPVIVIQLFAMPLIVAFASIGLALPQPLLSGAIIEAAMPSMVLGLVICDRFKLNTELYALAVTITTALSMLTIPLWFNWASTL